MSVRIRRLIDLVARVLGFLHANPFDEAALNAAVARLEERAARLHALTAQEQSGHIEAKAAILDKVELKAKIGDCITYLARLAVTVSHDMPSMPVRFTIPRPHSSQQVYLTGGRVVLSEALGRQELLAPYGLTPEFLTLFRTALDQYEVAINAKNAGTSTHVGANAELQELMVEIHRLVRLIDSINRPRFRNDPEKRAAWKSARDPGRSAPKTDLPPAAAVTPAADTSTGAA